MSVVLFLLQWMPPRGLRCSSPTGQGPLDRAFWWPRLAKMTQLTICSLSAPSHLQDQLTLCQRNFLISSTCRTDSTLLTSILLSPHPQLSLVAKIPRLTTSPTLGTVPVCGMGAAAVCPNTYSEFFSFMVGRSMVSSYSSGWPRTHSNPAITSEYWDYGSKPIRLLLKRIFYFSVSGCQQHSVL